MGLAPRAEVTQQSQERRPGLIHWHQKKRAADVNSPCLRGTNISQAALFSEAFT
jgi:hypothetical protein